MREVRQGSKHGAKHSASRISNALVAFSDQGAARSTGSGRDLNEERGNEMLKHVFMLALAISVGIAVAKMFGGTFNLTSLFGGTSTTTAVR